MNRFIRYIEQFGIFRDQATSKSYDFQAKAQATRDKKVTTRKHEEHIETKMLQ